METDVIYHEDCLVGMKRLRDKSIDLILCDLPYGVTQNKADVPLPLPELWMQYARVIKDDGVIVLTAQYPFTCRLEQTAPSCFKSYEVIWDKLLVSGHLNANWMPMRVHENVLVFYKSRKYTYNPQFTQGVPSHSKGLPKKFTNNNYGTFGFVDNKDVHGSRKFPTSIIRIQKPHPSKSVHRTEKPLELFGYLIKTYSNVGDLVLDNCIGSGTTAAACKELDRRFIGFDIDAGCIEVAKKKLDGVVKSLSKFTDSSIPPAPKEAGILEAVL